MSTALKLVSVEEFLPWAEAKEGRLELHDGIPVRRAAEPLSTSPERLCHTRIKGAAFAALAQPGFNVLVEATFPEAEATRSG